jgi:ABC-type transporter Mla MlaB component
LSAGRGIDVDVRGLVRPDVSTVDHLCRLAFHARGLGLELRLRNVSRELHELLDLAGVCEVCGCSSSSMRAARGETHRE